MQPLVSILIPAYNAEKWIAQTIQSASEQTRPNKEIIVVNDGSSDRTLSIIKRFESGSIKVIDQSNTGGAGARNTALRFAQGDYIQWLDADDLLSPDKIARQMKYCDGHRESLVLLSSSFGTFYYRTAKASFVPGILWEDLSPVEWMLRRFSEKVWMIVSSWLTSRRLVELAGPWDERLSFDDDGEYFCRVVSRSERIKFVRESKAFYRDVSSSSVSQDTSRKSLESRILSAFLCIDHLRSLEDSERTRSACLKFLQRRLRHVPPDDHRLRAEIERKALELGSNLSPVEESRKLRVATGIMGRARARLIKNVAWNARMSILRNWDRLLYHLSDRK